MPVLTRHCVNRWITTFALGLGALTLAGCASSEDGPQLPRLSDLNPFAEKEVPLTGKRVAIIQQEEKLDLASADAPIGLPPALGNDSWSQPGGAANNAPGHLAFSGAPKAAWDASAGTGSSTAGRLTASPIVSDGYVYTLDAVGTVTALGASSGNTAWRVATTPKGDKDRKGFGGGLAADNGRIYAATGYGTVVALEPKTGKPVWEKNLGTPIRSSPTASGGRIYVITTEGRVFCLAGADGAEVWSVRGLPERASLLSNVSPAVDGDMVIVAYPSGDLAAHKLAGGQTLWSESLSRTRSTSALASLSDAARPAIDGGVVFGVGHSGRMIAVQQKTGERLWTLNVPGIQPPWPAGDSVFVVDINGQLMAISRKDGKLRWTVKLPGAKTWSGPVLAGSKLWLTSSSGKLVGVAAETGKVEQTLDIGTPMFIAPVVAQGRMYVLTDKARLYAFN